MGVYIYRYIYSSTMTAWFIWICFFLQPYRVENELVGLENAFFRLLPISANSITYTLVASHCQDPGVYVVEFSM